jgi:hypothetical protein
MRGGQVDQNSGLGSIVVKRQDGKLVDLSIQELEKIITDFRIPGSEREKASRILMKKRKGEPDSSSATVAPNPLTTPPNKPMPFVSYSLSDDPLLEMSVEQEQPERGDTYIPSDEVDTVGFDPNIGQTTDSNNEGDGLKQTYNALNKLPGSEIRDKISKELETGATSRKARLDARKEGIDSDRWLALANFGIGILQQPGGETFLRTIAKGAKESGIIASLSKLNREEADIADKLDTIDLDTLMKKYQLSKDEAAEFVRERDYGFKVKQAQDNLTLAKEKLAVSRSAAERKLAQAQATAARDQLKMLLIARKPLGKDAQEEWTKQFRDMTKADNLRTFLPEEIIEKFDDLDLKDKDNLKEALRIKISEIRTLYPSLSETQLLRQAFPIVYGPFLIKKKKKKT